MPRFNKRRFGNGGHLGERPNSDPTVDLFDADEIGNLVVRRDNGIGDSSLEIRAYDGEDWSDWDEFTLNTVSRDDFFA